MGTEGNRGLGGVRGEKDFKGDEITLEFTESITPNFSEIEEREVDCINPPFALLEIFWARSILTLPVLTSCRYLKN